MHSNILTEEFRSFLQRDHRDDNAALTKSLRTIAQQNISIFRTKRKQFEQIYHSVLQLKENILSDVDFRRHILLKSLFDNQKRSETVFMKVVVSYFHILEKELHLARQKALGEQVEKSVKILQANTIRDVKIFAINLMEGSKSKLCLTQVLPESAQFERCEKAVLDNIEPVAKDLAEHVSVLSVFKLQNSFLAEKMQSTNGRASNGKIKGLFCCFPTDHLFPFAVFGLHFQRIISGHSTSADRLHTLKDSIFQTSWYSQVNNVEKRDSLSAASMACSKPLSAPLHFGRWSCLSPDRLNNICGNGQKNRKAGKHCFLALCRVLIMHQKTVSDPITENDIITACEENFDAIYSSQRSLIRY